LDIASWLRELGLECYEQAFRDNDIDLAILPELTTEDLADLGISSIGHRRKLIIAITALRKGKAHEYEPTSAKILVPNADRSTFSGSNAERRKLTVMFADLVGSTALSGELDPEDMRDVITGYQNTVAGVVTRFEGYVAKYMGDGVLSYFGWPKAHEDEAERAVRAGLGIAQAVDAMSGPDERALSARIGIATGLVVVGDLIGEDAAQEQAVVGETPNLAARLQSFADPGQVIVSEATMRLLGKTFEVADLGLHKLKGITENVSAFSVVGEGATESRFESGRGEILPIVGREQELALLMERWGQAKDGEGQCVLLVGEAGIGKSRIMRAMHDEIAQEPHIRLRYQCSPYFRDSALWPVIQHLRRAAGFAANASNDAKLDRVEALLAQAGTSEPALLIAELLDLDTDRYGTLDLPPQAKRAQILEALAVQVMGLADSQPVLLELEDAHWIDPTTLELVTMCLDRIIDCRVLIFITSRPEEQPQLTAHPHVTRLTLNRLRRSGVEAIIERLGGNALSSDVLDTIIARTDGVPLFVEELTKAILETGEATIPASLHDSMMARLDRFPEIRDIAQIASCIGRDFDYESLAAIADRDEQELIRALNQLVASELIFRRGTPPNVRYTFKHALVQDAAYEALLISTRQRLHERIAEVLEKSGSDELELLAEHYYRAGNSVQAVTCWYEAGQLAAQRSAYIEAIGHLQKGVAAVIQWPEGDERDRQELLLQLALTVPLVATQGYAAPKTRETYHRAEALCEALDDDAPLLPLLYGEWVHNLIGKADQVAACHVAKRFLDLAKSQDDQGQLVLGHRLCSTSLAVIGEFSEGLNHGNRAVELYDPEGHGDLLHIYAHDPFVSVQGLGRAFCLWHLGFPEQAQEAVDAALARAESLRHVNSIVHALSQVINQFIYRREYDALTEPVNRLNALAKEHRLALWCEWGLIYEGWLKATSGTPECGIESIKRGLAGSANAQSRMWAAWFHSLLSEALSLAGRNGEALQAIDAAIDLLEETHERAHEADFYRIKGVLLLAENRRDEATAHFRRSLDISIRQKAKSFELRTSVTLARLWAEQGDQVQAHDLLTPVYDWFVEGFGLPDLVEAKTLIDKLR